MSEYDHAESSPVRHSSDADLQNSLDDSTNNSIIGKVKSRVSSIFPNSLSKWFSPSSKLQNDSLNGSVCGANTTILTRRRRRNEVDEGNYDDAQHCGDYEESNRYIYPTHGQTRNTNNVVVEDDNYEDDDSQNSEDDYIASSDLNEEPQPPAKRSRLNIDVRDSPIIAHQPLLSSTPATNSGLLRNYASTSRSTYQRFTHLNLYGNQSKKDPAFNFGQQNEFKLINKMNTDIVDLITNSTYEQEDKHTEPSNVYVDSSRVISSRKSLNIPSTSTLTGIERTHSTVSHLKRQPLSSTTLSTLREEEQKLSEDKEQKHFDSKLKGDGVSSDTNKQIFNGSIDISENFHTNKRQKLTNGADLNAMNTCESNEGILADSASESGESAIDVIKSKTSNTQQRKTGLFNMSARRTGNTGNSSRTSSFGNGLNFYSHLEGRKSLFSGPYPNNSNPLNNSSLSLTSLNRRQFNASIYGSTSALSDSRLLNTFSPFYKGKTTYGGASAYNKYTAGACAGVVRITPTLIRPTSSLSTLSSSNNSLGINASSQIGENSAISSTAKRILDLINDFATPLSEAKKMASNLKTNPNLQITNQAKGRLNESDLNASRAMRLSQVRTPYSRPAVILQPSGNASGCSSACDLLPPVKELQVPTMSQLLQMKKMQNTTEKARKIVQNSVSNNVIPEYTLPDVTHSKTKHHNNFDQENQKHTNKIKNKSITSFRPSAASKNLEDEEPPPPLSLPNIAFPVMKSVPKIDLQLNKPAVSIKTNLDCKSTELLPTTETSNSAKMESSKLTSTTFNTAHANFEAQKSVSTADSKSQQMLTTQSSSKLKSTITFTFSEPLEIIGVLPLTKSLNKNTIDQFKFSPPLDVKELPSSNCLKLHNTKPQQPLLKEGSCLDVLNKPFDLPSLVSKSISGEQTSSSKAFKSLSPDFGNQFKMSCNEWECEICMLRNKIDNDKCVACETSRKRNSLIFQQDFKSPVSASATSFGEQFKKSSSEWECGVCMIRNRDEINECIACKTPRNTEVSQSNTSVSLVKDSFGNVSTTKPVMWECQKCMAFNKSEINECTACRTKRNGISNKISSAQSTVSIDDNKNHNPDVSFQILAAQQKASKWECDACMSRNDANRTKCACCEQPKAGITSAGLSTPSSTKFQFGATAASKFSFGFGKEANVPTEEELRKQLSSKTEKSLKPPLTEVVVGANQSGPAASFQFGITSSSASELKNNVTDSNKQIAGFKFGISTSTDATKTSETSVVPSSTNFIIEKVPQTTAATTKIHTFSSAVTANTSNVKFSLPPVASSTIVSNSDKSKTMSLPAFSFGTNTDNLTTKDNPSFVNKIDGKPTDNVGEKKESTVNNAFKSPVTTTTTKSFSFGLPTVNIISTTTSPSIVSNINTATSTTVTTSTTTAAIKPIFSFATNAATTSAANPQATSTSNPQAASAFNSFSFGRNTNNNVVANTTENTLFVAATSTTTTTANTEAKTSLSSLTTTTTTPASTNIFGTFGGGTGTFNTATHQIFGSSLNPPANNNLSSVSSSTNNANPSNITPFGSKTTSNVFGSFGVGAVERINSESLKSNNAKTALPLFGNVPQSSVSQLSSSSSSGFMFSSNTANEATPTATTATASSVTSTSTIWPKNSFVFGSTTATTSSAPTININENKEVAKPSVFGTFASSSTNLSNQQNPSSIFGAPALNIGSPTLGGTTSGLTNSSTNLFGTNSAPATTNIFGANSSGNAVTPASTFGSSSFGGAASSTRATPTFGSTAALSTTFGNFGTSPSNSITNATEVKKSEAAFNFGAALTAQSSSSGFNFGSSASTTKPAFNFGSTSITPQPTFNFTGTSESQSSTKPFQFGATPSASVFSFNRDVLEGTPNAPFQFNAGAVPVSSNIFAPTPTPGAQTAQQAKRKIRAPMRRGTQR